MPDHLKQALLRALAGSSGQNPIATEKLYLFSPSQARVEAALQALYEAREVSCCKITRGGVTRIVWWLPGAISGGSYYGKGAE